MNPSFAILLSAFLAFQTLLHAQTKEQLHPPHQTINPPFGLAWGESTQNTRKWINQGKYKSFQGTDKNRRVIIEVVGPFPNVAFDRIRFGFFNDQLNEVELQFNALSQTPFHSTKNLEIDTYTSALEIKKMLDSLYGRGHLLKDENNKEKDSKYTFIHNIWPTKEHSVWLVVFVSETTNPPNFLSIISVHYRWEKKIEEILKKSEKKKEKK